MSSFSWMHSFSGGPKRLAVPVVVVVLVAVAAAFAIALAHPEQVSSGALGPDWQCTRLALVFTTCTRVARAPALAENKALSCQRSVAWRKVMRVWQ